MLQQYLALQFASYFCKKAPPWMFEKVLSTSLCLVRTVGYALALHARASNFECF